MHRCYHGVGISYLVDISDEQPVRAQLERVCPGLAWHTLSLVALLLLGILSIDNRRRFLRGTDILRVL